MQDKLRVLLVSAHTTGSPGGIATWTNIYLQASSEVGIESTLVNTAQIGKRREKGNSKVRFTEEFTRTKNIFKELNNSLKHNEFDVAHVNSSCGPLGLIRDYLCVKRIKKKKIPIVTHFHCDIPFWIHNNLSRYFLKRIVLLSDKILVLCDHSKQYLIELLGAESEKVPNFVDEKLCLNTPREVNDTIHTLLFVGYVQPEKGVNEIYKLAENFKAKKFILAGEVRADVSTLDKPENVELIGRINKEDVLSLMDQADVFIFPTHSEGFSMSLSEAMSRGLPSITTDVGANADMIENKGGRILSVGDVKGMKDAIVEVEDAALRREMSAWCVKKVKENYTTPIVMNHFAKIYQSVMEKK